MPSALLAPTIVKTKHDSKSAAYKVGAVLGSPRQLTITAAFELDYKSAATTEVRAAPGPWVVPQGSTAEPAGFSINPERCLFK